MFKKISLIALLLIGATGAYALVANLFPDTVSFPRIPTGPGTIGYALTKFFGPNLDGTGDAPNTLALSGVDADGYVKRQDCPSGEAWLGIDASGIPQCGAKGTMLAFAILTDTGSVGVVTVNGLPGHIGMGLSVGDIVRTSADGSASIGFTTDDSVVRLDSDTSIAIQMGTLDGRTVAQINLDEGLLWGRVLTSTGINFGGGGYIAGVRGTSIAMSNNKTTVGITIPHSTRDTDAVTITNTGISGGMPQTITGGVGTSFPSLNIGSPYLTTSGPSPIPVSSKEDIYNAGGMTPVMSEWITLNTRKDIIYMDILYEESSSTLATKAFATGELLVTLPPANTQECENLLTGSTVEVNTLTMSAEKVLSDTIESSVKTEVCTTPTSKSIRCGSQGLVWWSTMNRCAPLVGAYADLTQSGTLFLKNGKSLEARYEMKSNDESALTTNRILRDNGQFGSKLNDPSRHTDWRAGSLLAASMWSTLDSGLSAGIDYGQIYAKPWVQGVYVKTLYPISWEGSIGTNIWQYDQVYYLSGVINHTPGVGVPITSTGQYLTYPINSLGNIAGFTGGTLAGKKITITVAGSPIANRTLVDFGVIGGTSYRVKQFGATYACTWGPCSLTGAGLPDGSTAISFIAPSGSNIKYFVLGNNQDTFTGVPTAYSTPINLTFKKIQIMQ